MLKPVAPLLLAATQAPAFERVTFPATDGTKVPVRLRTGLAFSLRADGTAHISTDPADRVDAILRVVPEFLAAAMRPNR